jgi:hypothetical protein
MVNTIEVLAMRRLKLFTVLADAALLVSFAFAIGIGVMQAKLFVETITFMAYIRTVSGLVESCGIALLVSLFLRNIASRRGEK